MPNQTQKTRTKAKTTKTKRASAVKTATKPAAEQVQKTSSTQVVSQHQSQDLAQTLIYSAIGTIAFLRSFFPDRCFDEQKFDVTDDKWSYEKFASGVVPNDDTTKKKIPVLRKGHHGGVDTVLNMLEKGAFDALQKKWLRALQLVIIEDPDHPEEVIESWTFSLEYTTAEEGGVSKTNLSMKIGDNAPVTLQNAKYALQELLRPLPTVCNSLPHLPNRRYLNVHLYYTDDCPKEYEPPGFKPVHDLKQLWTSDNNWIKGTSTCGPSSLGYHSVMLTASYLTRISAPDDSSSGTPTIPAGLKKSHPYWGHDGAPVANQGSAFLDTLRGDVPQGQQVFDLNVTEAASPVSESTADNNGLYALSTSFKRSSATSAIEEATETRVGGAGTTRGPNPNTQRSTQSQEARRVQKGVQKIVQPSPAPQGLEETYPLDSESFNFETLSQLWTSQDRLQLSQRKIEELGSRKKAAPNARKTQSRSEPSKGKEVDIVDCECGDPEEDGQMINCDYCYRWQHLVCYGYRNSDDTRIPQIHACYKCLLREKEPDVYRELVEFSLLRRAANFVIQHGYSNDKDVAEALNCHVQVAAQTITQLKREGFLVLTPGSNQRTFWRTKKPKYMAVQDPEQRKRLYATYFDPTFKIGHHLGMPERRPEATGGSTQFPFPSTASELDLESVPGAQPRDALASPFPTRQTQDTLQLNPGTPHSTPLRTYKVRRPQASTPLIHHSAENHQSAVKRPAELDISKESPRKLKRPRSSRGLNSANVGFDSDSTGE